MKRLARSPAKRLVRSLAMTEIWLKNEKIGLALGEDFMFIESGKDEREGNDEEDEEEESGIGMVLFSCFFTPIPYFFAGKIVEGSDLDCRCRKNQIILLNLRLPK